MFSKTDLVLAFHLGAAASAVGSLLLLILLTIAAPYLNRLSDAIKKRLEK